MNNMKNTGEKMVKVIDETMALIMTTVMSELGSEIAEDENTIKALALSAKAITISKDMINEQCKWFDETAEKIAIIEERVEITERRQMELIIRIDEVNAKLDILIDKMTDK